MPALTQRALETKIKEGGRPKTGSRPSLPFLFFKSPMWNLPQAPTGGAHLQERTRVRRVSYRE